MLNAAKQNDPRMSQTELGFALYYAGIGDNAKVIQSLDKAKKLDPLNVEVADWGHWSLAMVGEVDAAVNWSQQQLQIHPNISMLFSGASLSASLKGEHERAISLAETGIKLDSKAP